MAAARLEMIVRCRRSLNSRVLHPRGSFMFQRLHFQSCPDLVRHLIVICVTTFSLSSKSLCFTLVSDIHRKPESIQQWVKKSKTQQTAPELYLFEVFTCTGEPQGSKVLKLPWQPWLGGLGVIFFIQSCWHSGAQGAQTATVLTGIFNYYLNQICLYTEWALSESNLRSAKCFVSSPVNSRLDGRQKE